MRKALTLFAVLFVVCVLSAPSAMAAQAGDWNGQYVDNDYDDDGILNCVDDDVDGDGIPNDLDDDDCLDLQYGFGQKESLESVGALDSGTLSVGAYVRYLMSFLAK